ncbi:OTU domain-containing protein 7B-like [Contarinia nasturtii]|uniref:OTU domain-containing protein 7B-like n=1 Tax=Contarinia nasturtii TaxID=265458 RepID=UPI0012D4403B|nr:OTU domain-containing protein 7B-like [Contarinia nasturtii]
METQLVAEFVSKTRATPNDALSCLRTWGWDLKKALIDYNDTSTNEYFNGKSGLKVPVDTVDFVDRSSKASNTSQSNTHQRKSSLAKLDSVDIVDYKKLYRGISRATENENLVSRARTEVAMDLHSNCLNSVDNVQQLDMPDYTFTLPDLTIYSDEFRTFLEKDLIECSTLNSLETANRLNWWADAGFCRKLWPLATTGDGNCLLHAASLAMWGFHDRKLTLRTALHSVLSSGEYKDALWRRWRFQQTRLNKQAGFVYSEVEWVKEWEEIVCMASPEPRQSKSASRRRSVAINESIDDNATYESLEEVHIFALAHVLRRTIIVIADTVLRDMNGEAMAPIPFGGVYLPFEIQANECYRAPLLLTYDMAHFSALVSMEASSEQPPPLIPLIDFENVLLPIQFCIDPGVNFDWKTYDGSEGNWALTDREHIALLKEYLDIVYATPLGSPEEEISVDLVDEEYDKRIIDGELGFGDDANPNNGKSKAAKQLQSVAKQFGSIGKTMSKKIKKNIGSITKIGSNNSNGGNGKNGKIKNGLPSGSSTQSFTRQRVLCAQLKAKRHDYQDEMIKNYLECAQDRFMETERAKELREIEQQQLDMMKAKAESPVEPERETSCINAGCANYGTSATSYMCPMCFEKQKERELNNCNGLQDGPRYGTGNSKFYTHADEKSHKSIKRLPSFRRLNEQDQTLYLSNSTFYNDARPQTDVTSNEYRHGYTETTGKTVIIPIRMETDGTDCVDSGVARAYSAGNTLIQNGSNYSTSHPPPHNILGIGDPPISNGPYTSTINITAATEPKQSNLTGRHPHDVLKKNNGIISSYLEHIDDPKSSRIATPFLQAQQCRTIDCKFFGNANTNFYCSKCCQQQQQQQQHHPKTQSKILTDV